MDILVAHAERTPDAPALVEGARTLTWRALVERRNRLARALGGLGLGPGEHVIVYAQNSLEAVLIPAAVRAAGAIPVPMNHRLVADEVAYILEHSDARAVFVSAEFLPVAERVRGGAASVRDWIAVGAARPAWARHVDDLIAAGDPAPLPVDPAQGIGGSMIYTGGTTGGPRGAAPRGPEPSGSRPLL